MATKRIQISKHFSEEREERMLFIALEIGWGNEILKVLSNGRWECLTDTGVLLVKSQDEDFLITAYLPTVNKVFALYQTCHKEMPQTVKKTLLRNQKLIARKTK